MTDNQPMAIEQQSPVVFQPEPLNGHIAVTIIEKMKRYGWGFRVAPQDEVNIKRIMSECAPLYSERKLASLQDEVTRLQGIEQARDDSLDRERNLADENQRLINKNAALMNILAQTLKGLKEPHWDQFAGLEELRDNLTNTLAISAEAGQ
jgi:hypothetical protein